jgi:hypothetical protein
LFLEQLLFFLEGWLPLETDKSLSFSLFVHAFFMGSKVDFPFS